MTLSVGFAVVRTPALPLATRPTAIALASAIRLARRRARDAIGNLIVAFSSR
jgi:hypothetical protein